MNTSLLISVIVPVYNIEQYIEQCIESIINQTYKNLEIILVDDGSDDRCPQICDRYASLDKRIMVIHKHNGGLVSARKAGTRIAIGDYIVAVDGDDWIERDRIENLVNKGCTQEVDMIYMSGMIKEFDKRSVRWSPLIPAKAYCGREIIKTVLQMKMSIDECFRTDICAAMWMWAVKRQLLQENQELVDDGITVGEDQICNWLCLLEAESVAVIDECGYHYRQRDGSLMHSDGRLSPIWYSSLKTHLIQKGCADGELLRLVFMITYTLMLTDYSQFLERDRGYLYPFSRVKKNSRIAIYGAGKLGYQLVNFLRKSKDYQVILWVDAKLKESPVSGYDIAAVSELLNISYDYVVIAVIDAGIARNIRKKLIKMGIPEIKVATMDPKVICEEALPDKYWKAGLGPAVDT